MPVVKLYYLKERLIGPEVVLLSPPPPPRR